MKKKRLCSFLLKIQGVSLLLAGVLLILPPQPVSALGLSGLLPPAGRPLTEGWSKDGEQWKYRLKDGSLVQGGWLKDGDGWYYFDANGIMARDTTLTIEGHTYIFEPSGAWAESPAADPLFVHLPSGRYEASAYEHPWAGIRLELPDNSIVQTADQLNRLSAHDYIPSYYDFLAVLPDQSLFGVVIQYNSDPIETILADDFDVFSAFWGKYDFSPTAPQTAAVAGQTYQKVICTLPGAYEMDVYLRCQDNKALYLFVIVPEGQTETADRLIASVTPLG